MIVNIPDPIFYGICIFGGCLLISGIVAIFFSFPLLGYVVEASNALETAQQAVMDQMPPDWQKMYALLKETDNAHVRKAYFSKFIEDKHEPELTIDAFNKFLHVRDGCGCSGGNWDAWLANRLERFLIVDLAKVFGEMK